MAITVVVADDHEVVRSGIKSLLAGSGIDVVGEAAGGEEAVQKVLQLRPDVALLDVRMPDGDGLLALEQIRQRMPGAHVVMLSAYDNPTYVARSAALGAAEFLPKGATRQELVDAIGRAARGEEPGTTSVLRQMKRALRRRQEQEQTEIPLTNREVQVLRHLGLGLSNREIGLSLDISIETVKEHVQNILRKLDVHDRTQAAVWAIRRGLA